jgi:hypothetical protein
MDRGADSVFSVVEVLLFGSRMFVFDSPLIEVLELGDSTAGLVSLMAGDGASGGSSGGERWILLGFPDPEAKQGGFASLPRLPEKL